MTDILITTQGDENWVLSADGAAIYVAGNDGYVRIYNAQTGAFLYQVLLGRDLGAIALSPDGSQLAIVEEIASNVRQSQNWTSNTADVSFYVVDINTFGAEQYIYTVTGSTYTFADISWTDGDTLQVSQNILPGWSGWTPLATVELDTGVRTENGSYYAGGYQSAPSLLTIPNSDIVLLGQLGLSSAEYFLISPTGTSLTSNGIYDNNVYGYAQGIEAASGITTADHIVIVTGGSAHLYDGTMQYIVDLSEFYPSLGSSSGVAFSPDGSRIFFLDRQNGAVVVIDANTQGLVGSVQIANADYAILQLGAEIVVAADGEGFYYNTAGGIAYATIDLPDLATDGSDVIRGTNSDDVLDGRMGDDDIYGLAGNDWLIGGPGNDRLFGGAGIDIAAYDAAPGGVNVDLRIAGSQATGGAGRDTLDSIEGLSGSIFADRLTGDDADNYLFGFDGDDILNGGGGADDLRGENGNDALYGGSGNDRLLGGDGNDLLDGGTGRDYLDGGNGNDIYVVDSPEDIILESAAGGNDTMRVYGFDATIAAGVETLVIMTGAYNATGNFVANTLIGSDEANILTGLGGNDILDGRGNIDTAVLSGRRADYTITQTQTGVFQIVGPDGRDTMTAIEYLRFDDETMRLLPGTGVAVNFSSTDRATYQAAMNAIRDFDGNMMGGNGSWLRIGQADVNGDGDMDQIMVNNAIGRFATIGTAADGMVYFADHGWAGETRIAGIYVDPLVLSGDVVANSAQDSQRRFANDLSIENINRVLGADDYDGDGVQEVFFALTDGTAYLRALMHQDGNIRYANYQSQQEVVDYLTANGYDASTFGDWFGAAAQTAQSPQDSALAEVLPTAALLPVTENPPALPEYSAETHLMLLPELQSEFFG